MTQEKRPAFESAAVLVEPLAPPPDMRRPMATVFGALLAVLRVIAGVIWLVALAAQWDAILRDELQIDIDDAADVEAANAVLIVILVAGAVYLTIMLALAVLVYFGSNAARVTVMIFGTLSITAAAIDYFAGVEEITIRTTLLTLALDILVMLALSSRAARAYARRPRGRAPRT
ncbi:hypothetical protein [Agromyces laixinhei]|uniref:hypothetical protein n=1 Tax=Agromyces laixinhei TaxID=2585717 RepID=UPI0011172120|nr:hypothetical protein [Agromyces laixinhei]